MVGEELRNVAPRITPNERASLDNELVRDLTARSWQMMHLS